MMTRRRLKWEPVPEPYTSTGEENPAWREYLKAGGYRWVDGAPDGGTPEVTYRRLSEIEPERVEWIWHGYIAKNKLNILEGDPGEGKGYLTIAIAAHCTGGRPILGVSRCEPMNVLVTQWEDGAADTIRPRADAAGVILDRYIHVDGLKSHADSDNEQAIILPDHLPFIEQTIRDNDVGLWILDPLAAALPGSKDSASETQMRGILAPIAKLAERCRVTVIAVRHLVKAGGRKAITAGGGSIGIIGQARVGLRVDQAPESLGFDQDTRVLSVVKNNLTRKPLPVAYKILQRPADLAAHVEWIGEVNTSADEMAAERDSNTVASKSQIDEATNTLTGILESGEMRRDEVLRITRQAGLADRTVERAAKRLQVQATRRGTGKEHATWWSLSPTSAGRRNMAGVA